ncbi:MAG: hypothetical protein AABW84_01365 [Nanoarchaeota archaeon]
MKQGKIEQSVLVSILLAIVIGGVILVAVVFPVAGTGGGLSDRLCHFNMALGAALPTGIKFIAGTGLCQEIEVGTIDAAEYSKCPKSYNKDATKCGAYQLAVLADRCLYRGGGRGADLGPVNLEWGICFKSITVKNLGFLQISENEIKTVIKENEFSHKIKSDDIKLDFKEEISKDKNFNIYFVNVPLSNNYVLIKE